MSFFRPGFRSRSWTFTAGLLAGLAVAAITLATGAGAGDRVPAVFSQNVALAQSGGSPVPSVADVAERALPSVVNIASTRKAPSPSQMQMHPFFRDFFRHFGPGQAPQRMQQARGSGVIISADGVVVTNNHVVDKADSIKVVLSDKREFSATVVGTDPKSDLAVLKLKGAKNLTPLGFGDSDKVRLGEVVLAIGNPFGVGQTVTMGIVSAKGRANMGIVDYEDFIQTDAAINPGNSGGALVNMRGELIGINTAILSRTGGYQGIGFAIPTAMVRPIANSLLKQGKVTRSWLGVVIQEVTAELAKAMNLPTRRGVLISDVEQGGPADKAGLQRGDLVVRINGRKVDSSARLRNIVAAAGVGKTVKLEIYRDGKKRTLGVTLGELPGNLAQRGFGRGRPQAKPEAGGMSVAPLSREVRQRFRLPPRLRSGVVVQNVEPGTPAAEAGIRPGDVIVEVNRVRIKTTSQFKRVFDGAGKQVLLLVYRRGSTAYVLLNK